MQTNGVLPTAGNRVLLAECLLLCLCYCRLSGTCLLFSSILKIMFPLSILCGGLQVTANTSKELFIRAAYNYYLTQHSFVSPSVKPFKSAHNLRSNISYSRESPSRCRSESIAAINMASHI